MTEPKVTKKSIATKWLDSTNNGLTGAQLYDKLAAELGVSRDTARVYVSNWRKANGTQRAYKKRPKVEIGGE